MNKKRQHIIFIAMACALLGFVLVRQFYLHKDVQDSTQPQQQEDLALQVSQLIKSNADLRNEANQMQVQASVLQKSAQDKQAAQNSINQSIEQYKIILGLVPVKGEGVTVQYGQPLDKTQITDLVDSLRNIGAEAIAIDNKRITPTTGWDSKTFSMPYTIQVIGDKSLLKDALERRGGIMEQIGFAGTVREETSLYLPVAH